MIPPISDSHLWMGLRAANVKNTWKGLWWGEEAAEWTALFPRQKMHRGSHSRKAFWPRDSLIFPHLQLWIHAGDWRDSWWRRVPVQKVGKNRKAEWFHSQKWLISPSMNCWCTRALLSSPQLGLQEWLRNPSQRVTEDLGPSHLCNNKETLHFKDLLDVGEQFLQWHFCAVVGSVSFSCWLFFWETRAAEWAQGPSSLTSLLDLHLGQLGGDCSRVPLLNWWETLGEVVWPVMVFLAGAHTRGLEFHAGVVFWALGMYVSLQRPRPGHEGGEALKDSQEPKCGLCRPLRLLS